MVPEKNKESQADLSPRLVSDIRELVATARQQVVQAVNSTMVQTYWQIGRLIVEDEQQGESRAAYGKQQLQRLSGELTREFGKGFDVRNLRNMRAFYLAFPNRNALRTELSWTHYRILLRIDNHQAREWYMAEAASQHWSSRALERQVEQEAETLTRPLAQQDARHYLRDPYILDFLDLPAERYLEADLERGLIDNLQDFLLEMGKGFAFVARQQRLSTEDQDFYIDLVFYNFKLKCFLLVDLKLGKLTHQDVGQMDSYIRIYDQHYKEQDDNPTIGLILCSQKSEAVVKYSVLTDSAQMFAAKYHPYLPTEEELRRELERERSLVQQQLAQAKASGTKPD
ncbi:PDDEXK nuclease domain-containing protein [Halomonas sp. CH40]